MPKTLVLATDPSLFLARLDGARWECETISQIEKPRCLAANPLWPNRIYCGTAADGLWRSSDGGRSWERSGKGIESAQVTAVAIAASESGDGLGVAYAGTEPSRMYRSEDGGDTWSPMEGLTDLPSAGEWSFPPRPDTHHVRWIEPDPNENGRLFVAIEAGALVSSPDGGRSWQDRVSGGPYDTHTLASHPSAPGRLWSAAGDGYYESRDAGQTWTRPREGLGHPYCVGVAVAPGNPEIVIASAAHSPRQAYYDREGSSALYRKVGDSAWEPVREGLPPPRGMLINIPAAHASEPETFYTANNHGIFRSDDAGKSWEKLPLDWPDAFRQERAWAHLALDIG